MLNAYPSHQTPGTALKGAVWVDMIDPTDEERAAFEQAFGLHVPTRDQLSEIETTSRLRMEQETLYLTTPLVFVPETGAWSITPTGFVLSKNVLLTVRFEKLPAFDTVIAELGSRETFTPPYAFVRLIEVLVDRMADRLEASARDLDDASHLVFRAETPARPKLSRETAKLRALMIRTGRISERMAGVQYALVSIDRIAKFTIERCHEWIPADLAKRLHLASSDIASLEQFIEGLISRVQLLQDAASGIINIDQNEVMKVLTVASVVGIPPVLVAGIYGMNFKNMPEYDWTYGYPWALGVIVVTALLPLIWFKWKGWM
jgi:magnesium transporter